MLVLQVDRATLEERLDRRPADEWGSAPDERALVLRLHETGEDVPDGVAVDATRPLEVVVDEIVRLAGGADDRRAGLLTPLAVRGLAR